jgi:hypothetical protein
MKNRVPPILLAIALLAGCSAFNDKLDEQLANKSSDEKRVVLAETCGQEIAKKLKTDDPVNVRHSEKMKQICEEMTGKKVSIYVNPNQKAQ